VDCHKDVRPHGYLTTRYGQKEVLDLYTIITEEKEEEEE